MRIAKSDLLDAKKGVHIQLSLLFDETDGVVSDFKYFGKAPIDLLVTLELFSELCLRKNHDQLRRITAQILEKKLVEAVPKQDGLPSYLQRWVNPLLETLDALIQQVADLPLPTAYVAPPEEMQQMLDSETFIYENWLDLATEQKLVILEEVIAKDVRPYVALDQGNVKPKEMRSAFELVVEYEGSCTTCYSSTGATLSAIQEILRRKVHPELIVTPDLASLQHHH
jgi:NifU-like protein